MTNPPHFHPSKHEIHTPPQELMQIVYPHDEWYVEGRDPEAHQRELRLDRGFYMFLDWWKDQEINVCYPITDQAQYCLYGNEELADQLREMHRRLAPQQKLENTSIVFGMGAMHLLNAAVYATSLFHYLKKHSLPLYVTQQLPGYLELKKSLTGFLGNLAEWVDFPLRSHIPSDQLLEFVTTPGNPDGFIKKPQTNAAYIIHDRVNHMPVLFNNGSEEYDTETLENDWVSLFSLSKFLGFSGSRVGYAFVKDPDIARFMRYYIFMDTHGIAVDGQIRCSTALKHLLKGKNLESYTEFCRSHLRNRWKQLKEALEGTKLILLNQQGSNGWLKISVTDAEEYLWKNYRIKATYGPEYGVGKEYVRFNLLGKQNEFNELLYRLGARSTRGFGAV